MAATVTRRSLRRVRSAGRHTYRVRWHDPAHRFGRRHRFVLLANNGRPEVVGTPFD